MASYRTTTRKPSKGLEKMKFDSDSDSDDVYEESDTGISDDDDTLLEKKLELASDDEDFEDNDSEGAAVDSDEDGGKKPEHKTEHKTKLITSAMVKEWTVQLHAATPSTETLKEIVCAVTAAATQAGVAQAPTPYRVEGTTVFNSVISMCLTSFLPALEKILKIPSLADHPHIISHKNKKWKSVKGTVKNYCTLMLQLSGELSEGGISILRHLHKFVVCIAGLPGLARMYAKQMVSLWSKGENTQRVLAFLSISKLLRLQPELLENTLKDMHLNYVRNCSFVNPEALSVISFMQHSLVEIFLLNEDLAYQQVFLYIRQMAIHLRNAIKDKNEKNTKAVYNWQFVLSLGLWSQLLSTSHPSPKLQPLIFPLTQVTIGTIRLLPTVRNYPLRFHCTKYLSLLSGSTGTFIPILPFLLEVFEQVDFNKRHKTANTKKLNMSTILKFTKAQQGDKMFKEGLIEHVCELLFDYLNTQSHLVAFPELIVPMVVQLKDFLKKCKVAVLCKQVKEVLDKAEESAKVIEARRRHVKFNLTDIRAVEQWEEKSKEEGTPLSKFYTTYRKLRDRQLLQDVAGKNELTKAEKQVDNISLPKGPLRATSEERKRFASLFEEECEDDGNVIEFLPKGQKGEADKGAVSDESEETDYEDVTFGDDDEDAASKDESADDDGDNDDVDEESDSDEPTKTKGRKQMASGKGEKKQTTVAAKGEKKQTAAAAKGKKKQTSGAAKGEKKQTAAAAKGEKRSATPLKTPAKKQKVQLEHDEGDMVDDFDLDNF